MYTTVFIDWYRTLSTSQFWLHLEDPTHQYHSLLEPLRHTLFREQNWVFEDWLIGSLRSEQVMEILAQHTKIPYELIWHEFVSGFTHHKLVSEEIFDLIAELKAHNIWVVIATDNMDCFDRWCVPALALDSHFDDILNSFHIGHLKKDVADGRALFFDNYMKRHNIAPGESIIFDDSPNLGRATSVVGIEYCQIDPGIGLVPELHRFCENL